MWEFENWSIFRSFPIMMKFDRVMTTTIAGIKDGTIKVPDYMSTTNPPSLWSYFLTLPRWCRENPLVRNVFVGFEYHKPTMTLRQKEMALNLACSFIRPIDKQMEDVIVEVATSTKLRLNMERVRFYAF